MDTNNASIEERISPLSVLIRKVIGKDSLEVFEKKSGIRKETLSRLRRGTIKNIPKEITLEKIMDAASQSCGVTLNDLLSAAGYELRENLPMGLPVVHEGRSLSEEIVKRSDEYVPTSAILSAISLSISYLFSDKDMFDMNLTSSNNYFKLQSGQLEQKIMGIPAFIGRKNDQGLLNQTLATIIVTAANITKEEKLIVITDSEEIFSCLKMAFLRLNGEVLLTKDYVTIAEHSEQG